MAYMTLLVLLVFFLFKIITFSDVFFLFIIFIFLNKRNLVRFLRPLSTRKIKNKNNTNGKAFKILLVFAKYEFYNRSKSQRRRGPWQRKQFA